VRPVGSGTYFRHHATGLMPVLHVDDCLLALTHVARELAVR
jgi:hypothetical protein